MRVYLQRSGPWRPLFLDAGSEAALSSLGEVVSEPDPRAPGIAERLRGCTAVLSLNGHGAEDVTAGVLREAGTVELVCVAHSWGHFGGLERETGVRVVEVSNAGTRAVAGAVAGRIGCTRATRAAA